MICPSCGAEVPQTKFCENCGNPLTIALDQAASQGQPAFPDQPAEATAAFPTEPVNPEVAAAGFAAQPVFPGNQQTVPLPDGQQTVPLSDGQQPVFPGNQQTVPLQGDGQAVSDGMTYVAEVPGDAAWQAQPPQAYQADTTWQMPPQPDTGAAPGAAAPQPMYTKANTVNMPPANRAPSAAFVLVIVGLVLSVLFVTFLPGLVCSIIGLALNAGYNKKGLDNPRKTSTMVIGIIGVVIGALCAIVIIVTGVLTAQVLNELESQGIDITADSVEVTTTSSGAINVTVNNSKSSASTSASAASSSAASSTSSSASDSTESSAASSTASPAVDYSASRYHDAEYNPTLFSIVELTGAEMQDLLDSYNFQWDDDYTGWVAADGSLYGATDIEGALGKSALAAFPKGAAGQPVVLVLTVEGYDTPTEAFNGLTKDIVTEDMCGDDDVFFGIVYGSPMVRYLVAVTETDDGEQTFLLFTEESISSGLFEDIIGVNAGSTMDAVWQTITGGSHIGGYIGA